MLRLPARIEQSNSRNPRVALRQVRAETRNPNERARIDVTALFIVPV
jgi:hypothetical protein